MLEKFGVEMIGANADTIDKAEDRSRFDKAMKDIGLACPRSGIAHSMEEPTACSSRSASLHHPSVLHHGRHRRRYRLQP